MLARALATCGSTRLLYSGGTNEFRICKHRFGNLSRVFPFRRRQAVVQNCEMARYRSRRGAASRGLPSMRKIDEGRALALLKYIVSIT